VASNPAYFMDPTQSKLLYAMASALDVFVIWSIVLMGIGFACSKVKRSTAIFIVAGWYVLYKLAGAALASLQEEPLSVICVTTVTKVTATASA